MLASLAAEESSSQALLITETVLLERADRVPAESQHLRLLANGLREGTVSLAEVEQVLRIMQLLQDAPAAASSQPALGATAPAAQPNAQPGADPGAILSALDGPGKRLRALQPSPPQQSLSPAPA